MAVGERDKMARAMLKEVFISCEFRPKRSVWCLGYGSLSYRQHLKIDPLMNSFF
jgi:hypothetical protein